MYVPTHSLQYDDFVEYFGIREVTGIAVIGRSEAHATVMKRGISGTNSVFQSKKTKQNNGFGDTSWHASRWSSGPLPPPRERITTDGRDNTPTMERTGESKKMCIKVLHTIV